MELGLFDSNGCRVLRECGGDKVLEWRGSPVGSNGPFDEVHYKCVVSSFVSNKTGQEDCSLSDTSFYYQGVGS